MVANIDDENESQFVIDPMIFEEKIRNKEKLILKLKNDFPLVYVLVHSILVLGLGNT
jgi:hypothetical protein